MSRAAQIPDQDPAARRRAPRTYLAPPQVPGPIEEDAGSAEYDADGSETDISDDMQPESTENGLASDGGLLLEATRCEIAVGADQDVFSSTLLLGAADGSDEEIAVALRLTPTVITAITRQLTDIFRAQQDALGVVSSPSGDETGADLDEQPNKQDSPAREGLLRRASDPLGMRHLQGRPQLLKWLAVGIGSLVVLSVIAQLTVYR